MGNSCGVPEAGNDQSRGYVYVITNKAMPGLVKLGYTTKTPKKRAAKMNGPGSPHPFIVAFEMIVENPRSVEGLAHKKLNRLRERKEWFRCSVNEAVSTIKMIAEEAKPKPQPLPESQHDPMWRSKLRKELFETQWEAPLYNQCREQDAWVIELARHRALMRQHPNYNTGSSGGYLFGPASGCLSFPGDKRYAELDRHREEVRNSEEYKRLISCYSYP